MAFQTGTMDDYKDAVADLRTLALANGWQEGVAVDGGRYTTSTEDEWIATGTGGGADAITCGIRTYSSAESDDWYNWEIAGMDQYTDANTWTNQPGISPGRYDGASNAIYGAYVPLCNRDMNYWISATSRRMCGVIQVGNVFVSFYIGWAQPHDTIGNYADPKVIAGTMYDPNLKYNSMDARISGVLNPRGSATSGREGSCHLHDPAGSWQTVKNANTNNTQNLTTTGITSGYIMYPMGYVNLSPGITGADSFFQNTGGPTNSTMDWEAMMGTGSIDANNFPALKYAKLGRTPNPGGSEDTIMREPAIIHELDETYVTLDGIQWCSAFAGPNDPEVQPGDRFQDPDTSAWYRVFPMGWNTEDFNYLALEEK